MAILCPQSLLVSREGQSAYRKEEAKIWWETAKPWELFKFWFQSLLKVQLHFCPWVLWYPCMCLLIIKSYFPFNKLNLNSGTCNQRPLNSTAITAYLGVCFHHSHSPFPSFSFLLFSSLSSASSFSLSSLLLHLPLSLPSPQPHPLFPLLSPALLYLSSL